MKGPTARIKVQGKYVFIFVIQPTPPLGKDGCPADLISWRGFLPRSARAIAFKLLKAADQAEGRKTPGPKPKGECCTHPKFTRDRKWRR
jgi:hypothetical protein